MKVCVRIWIGRWILRVALRVLYGGPLARGIWATMDTFADGLPILTEGPCWTADGRFACIEPFRETPMAIIKDEYDPKLDEDFLARDCFSKPPADRMTGL